MSRQVQDDVKDNVQVQDNVQDNVQDKKKKAVTLSNFFVSTKERAKVNSAKVNSAMVNSVSASVNRARASAMVNKDMDKGNIEDCWLMSKKRKRMTDEEAEALAEADMQALLKAQEPEQVPASLEPASLEPALLEDDVISFGVTRAECEGCQLLAKGLGGENQASHACLGF